MPNNLKTVVYGRVEAIKAAEKVTRAELAAFSREALMYVPESNDIDVVNRLISVLTPVNKRAAILFFRHFLPWDQEKDTEGNHSRFGGKMQGEKKIAKREALIAEFLADENNNIWTWTDANVEMNGPIDYQARITSAIKSALKGNEKRNTPPLDHKAVLDAVFAGGLTANDFMAFAEVLEARKHEAEKFLAAVGGEKEAA